MITTLATGCFCIAVIGAWVLGYRIGSERWRADAEAWRASAQSYAKSVALLQQHFDAKEPPARRERKASKRTVLPANELVT
jgi:hypothetical protein